MSTNKKFSKYHYIKYMGIQLYVANLYFLYVNIFINK